MVTALINNRAVILIGLLDNRAVNLIDLEHSTHFVMSSSIFSKKKQTYRPKRKLQVFTSLNANTSTHTLY